MKYAIAYFIMLGLFLNTCYTQKFINLKTYNVDSLLQLLPGQQGEERINTLNNLAVSLSFIDFTQSKQYADEAMSLSTDLNYEEGKAVAFRNYGHIHMHQGIYPQALSNYLEALSCFEKLNKQYEAAWMCYYIAYIDLYARNFEKIIEYGDLALDKFRERTDEGKTVGSAIDSIRMMQGLAITYLYMGMINKSNALFLLTLDFSEKHNFDMRELVVQAFRLGENYLLLGKTDSAKLFYDKAIANPDANSDIQTLKYRTITGLGNLYFMLGKVDTAIYYLQKAFKWYNKTGFLYWALYTSNNLGTIYYKKGEITSANQYFRQSERIFNEMITKNSWYRYDSLRYIVNFGLELYYPFPHRQLTEMMWTQAKSMYYNLFQISEKKKDIPDAFKYHIEYFNATDTLNKLQRNREIIEIQTRYESERKDQQIGILSKDITIQKLQIGKQQQTLFILILILVIVVIGLFIIFYMFRLKHRLSHQLEEKVKERTQELNQAHEKLKVLDEAKSNFLKIISHEIRTPLNGIKGFTGLLRMEIGSNELHAYLEYLEKSVDRLEKFSLNALMITQLNLGTYKSTFKKIPINRLIDAVLSLHKEEADLKSLEISTDIKHADIHVDEELIKSALECVVENAIRFSPERGKIQIKTHLEENQYVCEIQDEGEGFSNTAINNLFKLFSTEQEHVDQNEGLGLALCKLIVDYHQGELLVENLEPTGANVTIKLAY